MKKQLLTLAFLLVGSVQTTLPEYREAIHTTVVDSLLNARFNKENGRDPVQNDFLYTGSSNGYSNYYIYKGNNEWYKISIPDTFNPTETKNAFM